MNLIWHFKGFNELTSTELYKILQLRINVFIVEQNCPYEECDDKDFHCKHLWCEIDNQIVAYCRIVPKEISYNEPSIGRVITHPQFRDHKLGHQLMRHSLEIIQNHFHTNEVRISAQAYLKRFYETYGFKQVSDEYIEDRIPHIEMLRQ